ncbi:hypothetical protein [Microbacterium sp. C7(2022)]|uniref:hypothetical protein n=1 Tax=Microbacterium sp. C7(2022) TaxID=2992759 RepID=UPI00237B99B3|nr:hypothetical protein [Microbacterium sp. C7(2022)]MDE0546317.1 hypothetical protein [Microbacterium sp. C7(2022)]
MSYPFHTSALLAPVDKAEVKRFRDAMRASGRKTSGFGSSASSVIVLVIIGVVFVGFILPIFVTVFTAVFAAFAGEGMPGLVVGGAFSIVPLLFVAGAVAVVIVIVRGSSASAERMYRLDRFARDNAMAYEPRFDNPGLPGMIFGQGSSRRSTDLVRGYQPRFVEFANYRYTTGSGKNQTTHTWGYVAVKLDVPLPHIVLDALGNNALFGSNLPASFDKNQRLSLEGDFDRYFSLYCPAGYERDALYLFTPDIMARFIDNAAALDVEIVDDWLFLYAKRDFSTLDPATWAWLFSVVGALLDKLQQWARWRDDRLRDDRMGMDAAPAHDSLPFTPPTPALSPPPGVAQPGQRLKRRIPWVAIALIGGFGLFWLFLQFGGMAALFGGLLGAP